MGLGKEIELTIMEKWFLIKLYDDVDKLFSEKELLKITCKEGLNDLQLGSTVSLYEPITNLLKAKYISKMQNTHKITITNLGIVYVRQHIIDYIVENENVSVNNAHDKINTFFMYLKETEPLKKADYIVKQFVLSKELLNLVLDFVK